jgi:UDP-N-acetylmuramate--alanine ligase
VTNIDREHMEHYRDMEEIASAFTSFMNKVPFYGAVVACADSPRAATGMPLQGLFPRLTRRVITYGMESGADVWGSSIEIGSGGLSFTATARGQSLGRFFLHVPGRHNVQNALAAVAAGLELDLSADQIRDGLERFRGTDRRFQVKADSNGVIVVDDYGHHPTEIRATLEAARTLGPSRIWIVFQPHRYTRTQFLMDEFATCFDGCDRVYVLDIYPASEMPIPGITSRRLVDRMRELGSSDRARYAESEQAVIEEILSEVRPGDLVLTIGAGSVWRVADGLAEQLKAVKSDK